MKNEENKNKIMETVEKLHTEIENVLERVDNERADNESFSRNDILMLEKMPPYTLLIKSIHGIKLHGNLYYHNDDKDITIFKEILNHEKFKNIRIDKKLINLLEHTDNEIFKRNLFYPAFFIDSDFRFYDGRFIVKGIMVFESYTVRTFGKAKHIEIGKGRSDDLRIHFGIIDKKLNDLTYFGTSFNDITGGISTDYIDSHILPNYKNEKKELKDVLEKVAIIVCNVIDLVEGNKNELNIKYVVPSEKQIEKRKDKKDNEKEKKSKKLPITTTVIIKPKNELFLYTESFEKEHKKVKYSHKFVVRGHWRHFLDMRYKNVIGTQMWIKPYVKGKGILVNKDAFFKK